MNRSAIASPETDPTHIFELFRGIYGSQLLTIAIAHFDVFGRLSRQGATFDELRQSLGLQVRPANVLVTALRAMGLIALDGDKLVPTTLSAEHLIPGGEFDVGDYVSLSAQSPAILEMVQLLKEDRPLRFDGGGAAFIYRNGLASAMEATESARHFTLALAGRAKNVAPALADALDVGDAKLLVDVGGGTGIYSFALLQKNTTLRAVVVDRPEVLRVAEEMAAEYGVSERVELMPGDMFDDQLPSDADIVLLSNILHDWDVPECKQLVQRCADSIKDGGRVVIHDVFLDDDLGGPLPIALYSAALFTLTQGRAYSEKEYRGWLADAGLTTEPMMETLVHCGIVVGTKPAI